MSEDAQRVTQRARQRRSARQLRWRVLLGQLAPLLVGALVLIVATLLNALPRIGARTPVQGEPAFLASDGRAAPDFSLTNQFGAAVALGDLRGKVVVLTFLYSSCPDLCPITVNKFGMVHAQLGTQSGDVTFLVVTVDPERDDTIRLRQYLAAQGLDRQVSFLTGDRAAVERVWREYGITVARGPVNSETGAYEVVHTDRIYLIDRAGCLRGLLRSTAPPQELLIGLAGPLAGGNAGAVVRCG